MLQTKRTKQIRIKTISYFIEEYKNCSLHSLNEWKREKKKKEKPYTENQVEKTNKSQTILSLCVHT